MDGFTKSDEAMEEEQVPETPSSEAPQPPYVEVYCKCSDKIMRFARGTEAGFAVRMINDKLDISLPPASHIEAVKEGEESISFGNTAVLVNYGKGWKLQTVHEDAYHELKRVRSLDKRFHKVPRTSSGTAFSEGPTLTPGFHLSFQYVGKVVLAFCFIFLIGGALTFILENAPLLVSFVSFRL